MDQIAIKDLEVYCHHGLLKEENILGQKFLVTALLGTDIAKAGSTDDIGLSINYAEVSHFIEEYMKNHTFRLLETVAEQLARQLLLHFSLIQEIHLIVKKPWAPILLPLDTVSVEVTRSWNQVYLSIGSNMGDRQNNLDQAITALQEDEGICDVVCSEWIETKPYGYIEQADFLNGAVGLKTLYSPEELLDLLHKIEHEGGRERTIHWGPRTIDLDILLYNDEVIQTERLTIPHREMHMREFVLEPLCQIAPWVKHPVFCKTILEIKGELKND